MHHRMRPHRGATARAHADSLSHKHVTVTMCNEVTPDLAAHTRVADVVVAAAGVAHLVQPDWIRPGAAVLSVGITRTVEESSGTCTPMAATWPPIGPRRWGEWVP